ncbi:phosphotransferase [Streptomyces sp. NEAU-NA10]|uniref:phosphotransferase n=1 Tax=Streptomyces sp. NEAU-NA10 TaxID=3416050 RepID=UPI003CC5ED60
MGDPAGDGRNRLIPHQIRRTHGDWPARLGPGLPVAAPAPLERGEPGERFCRPWSVYRWPDGRNPVAGALEKPKALAAGPGAFLAGLRRIDPQDGPVNHRGVPPEKTVTPREDRWRTAATARRRPCAGRRCRACPWRAWRGWRGRPCPGRGR